jgi:TPR repeat protein
MVNELIHRARKGNLEAQDQCVQYFCREGHRQYFNSKTLNFFFWKDIRERCLNDSYAYFVLLTQTTEPFPGFFLNIQQRAMTTDNPAACYNLSIMYGKGLGVDKNRDNQIHWCRLAADKEFAPAQAFLPNLCGNESVEYKERALYYQRSAIQGWPLGQYKLAMLYSLGEGGVPQSHDEAFKWFQLAAKQGFAPAQAGVGHAYFKGLGVEKNDETACFYWDLATQQKLEGAKERLIFLQKTLANNYQNGIGVSINREKAFCYWQRAADLSDGEAFYKLSFMYKESNNLEKGLQCVKFSADLRFLKAQEELGILYYKGPHVKQNLAEAQKYLQLAALQGAPRAQEHLAALYREQGDPLRTIKFSLMAIRNPQTKEEVRDKIRQILMSGIACSQEKQEYEEEAMVEEEHQSNVFPCLNKEINELKAGCIFYKEQNYRKGTFNVGDQYVSLFQCTETMTSCVKQILEPQKQKPGFCITCVQPTPQLEQWANERGSSLRESEKEGFCFFKIKDQLYSCVGDNNPELGRLLKDFIEEKSTLLSNLEKFIIEKQTVAGRTQDEPEKTALNDEINFLINAGKYIIHINDRLEQQLSHHLPRRNRVFRNENKALFGEEDQ